MLIYENLGGAPPGPGMPFLESDTCAGGGNLFLSGFSSLYDAIHGWMTGRMDGWKKLHEKGPRRPLLYVIAAPVCELAENFVAHTKHKLDAKGLQLSTHFRLPNIQHSTKAGAPNYLHTSTSQS
jgi:hypothetical protein